jgi:hypothetical protein
MSSGELLGMIALIAVSVLMFGALAVGLMLVIRDTIRQRGNWGVNFKPAACTECGTPAPLVRKPANWRQAMWGGWTCKECGFELDKWGRPVAEQNELAKWAVLRGPEQRERRRPRDERIRDVHDQTRPGDAS